MGLHTSPSVESSDGARLILPGTSALAGRGGQSLKVNAGGTAYELGAGGGFTPEQVEVYSTNGSVKAFVGQNIIDFAGITYQAPWTPSGAPVPSWFGMEPGAPYSFQLAPGWYTAVVLFNIRWDAVGSAPDAMSAYIGGGTDAPHGDSSAFPKTRCSSATWGLLQYVNYGPTEIRDSSHTFHAEARPIGGAFTVANNSVLSHINWLFTKIG